MIDSVFNLLADPSTPWILALIIAVAAVWIWIDFRRRLAPVLSGLDSAIACVVAVDGPTAFKQRFSSTFQTLAENPVLGDAWRGYAATLTVAPGSEQVLSYSRRPEEDINQTLLPMAGVNLRFYLAVPNLLIGAGLLFTFLGLVAALRFASEGVASSDIAEAQTALRDLLAAATFKFVTSIVGLGASLVFSWREKAQLYRVERRLGWLCSALEARMQPVTPESLLMAQIEELRSTNTMLQRISKGAFVRVPETIETRLGDDLARALAPLKRALERAATRLDDMDRRLLEGLLEGRTAPPSGSNESGVAPRVGPKGDP